MKLLIFVFLCSGCAAYVEVGVGANASFSNKGHVWEDGGAGIGGAKLAAGIERTYGRTVMGCEYAHYSQWYIGPPFDNRAESSLDHVGCSVRRYIFQEQKQ